jgi:uncharacterized protein involved in exopolysaccharide biosynthesis
MVADEHAGASSSTDAEQAQRHHGLGERQRGLPSPTPEREDDPSDNITFLTVVNILLKHWRLVAGLPLASVVLAGTISLVIPARFTATTTFVAETDADRAQLPGRLAGFAGLATQFGISIPGSANSPQFYADLLHSRTIRDQVLRARFMDPRRTGTADSASLLDILDIEGSARAQRLERGRDKLGKITTIRVDNETNVVSLSVETRYPSLSADVGNLHIELLNRFNLEFRSSHVHERRRFIEERLAQTQTELRAAEDALASFLEGNRRFEISPDLTFQYERLQRQVSIKQEVFTTLRRSYEETRIEEVNDTPVITIIDAAVPPQEKSGPKRTVTVLITFVLTGFVALFAALAGELLARARDQDSAQFDELLSRLRGIGSQLRLPGRHT